MAKRTSKKDLRKGFMSYFGSEEENQADEIEEIPELGKATTMIKVEAIEVNPYQPRKDFDPESLNVLAESLKIHGLIQPITVRDMGDGKLQIISGERRWRAAQLAGLSEIPGYIREANDQEMIEMALIENLQRENLNPIEIATTYKRLIDECNLTHEEMSQRVGKSRTSITNHLRLLTLPVPIQEAVKNKDISGGHAVNIAGVKDLSLQLEILRKVIDQQLSVRATEALTKAYREEKPVVPPKPANALPDDYRNVEENLRKFLGAKVALKLKGKGKGQIVIPFNSVDDLNRLLELIEEQ